MAAYEYWVHEDYCEFARSRDGSHFELKIDGEHWTPTKHNVARDAEYSKVPEQVPIKGPGDEIPPDDCVGLSYGDETPRLLEWLVSDNFLPCPGLMLATPAVAARCAAERKAVLTAQTFGELLPAVPPDIRGRLLDQSTTWDNLGLVDPREPFSSDLYLGDRYLWATGRPQEAMLVVLPEDLAEKYEGALGGPGSDLDCYAEIPAEDADEVLADLERRGFTLVPSESLKVFAKYCTWAG